MAMCNVKSHVYSNIAIQKYIFKYLQKISDLFINLHYEDQNFGH